MATRRMVSAQFWADPYIEDLDWQGKYFFLYLITNPHGNIAGIYELSISRMQMESGMDKEFIIQIIAKFQKDGKIHYEKNWIVIRNFVKYQVLNPSIKQGIIIIINSLPQWLQERLVENPQNSLFEQGSNDSLGTDCPQPVGFNLIKLNLIKSNVFVVDKKIDQKIRPIQNQLS